MLDLLLKDKNDNDMKIVKMVLLLQIMFLIECATYWILEQHIEHTLQPTLVFCILSVIVYNKGFKEETNSEESEEEHKG